MSSLDTSALVMMTWSEVKLVFVKVKKAHPKARCDEEVIEEWVELPEEFG